MRKSYKIFLFFLFIYSVYCSLVVGRSWDEDFQLFQGKVTLDYLLTLGRVDNYHLYREFYAPIYWTFNYLIVQIFPQKYQVEVSHLYNLIFSLSVIFGTSKLCKELFNKKIGEIVFLILFFYPMFFGHMSFNGKDTVIVFSHIWIFYLIIRYFKKQNLTNKINGYLVSLGALTALGCSIHLTFIGSLAPIFLFVLIEIFFLKKFINSRFSKKKFFVDIIKAFFVFYFILVIFWIDTHQNIFILPFNYFYEHFTLVSGDLWRGWPFNLLDGKYYISSDVSKFNILINLLYKSPEYFLLTYVIFFIIYINYRKFFRSKFHFFEGKLILILSIIFYPIVIGFFTRLIIYDGMRHFLWIIPYICIIPALTIYFLIETFDKISSKITMGVITIFIIFFLYNFFLITPYQYTYLNSLNGKVEERYKRFENDYWASSVYELMKKASFDESKDIKFSTCGVPAQTVKIYLKEKGYYNFGFAHPEESDYIIMTNRVTTIGKNYTDDVNKLTNCFDKFKGKNIFEVKRAGMLLSTIRKID